MPLSNFSLPNAPGPDIVPLASFIQMDNDRNCVNWEIESFQILNGDNIYAAVKIHAHIYKQN